jgi:probable phosphoglycerate mutase
LSAKGVEQADVAAQRLANLAAAPSALYASPLERTRETAAPIARALNLRVTNDRGLLECDFGDWTGKTLASLRRKPEWRAVQNAPSTFRFPNGESFTEMQLRIWTTLERLAGDHPGETVVVVSHADPIKAAVTYAQGVPLDLFQRTVISTCSISAVVLTGTTPIVLSVNNTGSLKELIAS